MIHSPEGAPVATSPTSQPEATGPGKPGRGERMLAGGSTVAYLATYGMVVAATLLLLVASALPFAARHWWVADLASHLRLQTAIALVVCAMLLALLRSTSLAAIALVAGALNMLFVVALYLPASTTARPGSRPLSLLVANVHRENDRYAAVTSLVEGERPDVAVLLEVDREWMRGLESIQSHLPHAATALREDDFGVAVLSRYPLTGTATIALGRTRLPAIATEIDLGDRSLGLLAVHPVPPVTREGAEERNLQLEQIADEARSRGGALAVCGDLNLTPWSPYFSALLDGGGLLHAGRGFGWHPTWPSALPGLLRLPIDHCLVRPEVGVRGLRRGPEIGSDHLPILVDLAVYR